jgi:hypothetical protein
MIYAYKFTILTHDHNSNVLNPHVTKIVTCKAFTLLNSGSRNMLNLQIYHVTI